MYQPHDGASPPRTQLPTRRFPLPHPLLGFVMEKQSEAVAKTAPLPQGFSVRKWERREKCLSSTDHVSPHTP